MKAPSEGAGRTVREGRQGSLVWLSTALRPMSERASRTLCCFRESGSSQAAPLPDRVRQGCCAAVWGAEECYAPTHSCFLVGPTHSSPSTLRLLGCPVGSWGMETS